MITSKGMFVGIITFRLFGGQILISDSDLGNKGMNIKFLFFLHVSRVRYKKSSCFLRQVCRPHRLCCPCGMAEKFFHTVLSTHPGSTSAKRHNLRHPDRRSAPVSDRPRQDRRRPGEVRSTSGGPIRLHIRKTAISDIPS